MSFGATGAPANQGSCACILATRAALEADLDATARRGFALDDGGQAPEVRSLGAPVLDRHGAISLTVPASRMTQDELLARAPEVKAAAARIAVRLPPSLTAET